MNIDRRMFSRRLVAAGAVTGMFSTTTRAGAQGSKEVSSTLGDQLAITQLLHNYAIALDSLDAEALAQCWATGALGPEQIRNIISYHRTYEHTMHNVTNHSYRVQADAGTGVAYCVASMVKKHANQLTKFDVYFKYVDDIVSQNGKWLLSKRSVEIVFSSEEVAVQPGAPLLGRGFKPGSFRKHIPLDSAG